MKWTIDKNVISSIKFNSEEVINPWGVETSDTSAFFSLEDGIGYRYETIDEREEVKEHSHSYQALIKMMNGSFKIKLNEKLEGNKVIRTVEIVVVEDLPLMDFVMRFRFKDDFFNKAEIDEKSFKNDGSNIYHQFKTDRAKLIGDKLQVKIVATEFVAPTSFDQCMYVRSRNGEWIVHARMIPNKSDRDVIKLCSRWFKTRPLPEILSDFLLKSKRFRKGTWYRGERNPFKSRILNVFNPNSFPMIELREGDVLRWTVECEISER